MSDEGSSYTMDSLIKLFESSKITSSGEVRRSMAKFSCYTFRPNSQVSIPIYSYVCQESAYRKSVDSLPCHARGMFVKPTEAGELQVVVRGYDKFFNIEETPETKWENLAKTTIGPYHLTVKENGCIIFVSAIEGHLIVTSKHALGQSSINLGSNSVSHSEMGEIWLDRHLKRSGAAREELVGFLSSNNVTAAFELVDDEFEEHIIPYPIESRGLYLHGINKNETDFQTWDNERLVEFAGKFGFFVVESITKDSISDVKDFVSAFQKLGTYNDKPIEGFVVRCKCKTPARSDTLADFFFKIKFDPYSLFRQWRNINEYIVSGEWNLLKQDDILSRKYIMWAIKKRSMMPELFERCKNEKKGVIELRNLFLTEENGIERLVGPHVVALAKYGNGPEYKTESSRKPVVNYLLSNDVAKKTLLIPVATVGAGKSTLARALKTLFPSKIGHIQNDHIAGKKTAPIFTSKVLEAFDTYDIVFADRNNHLDQHREQLSVAFKTIYPKGNIIVLDWGVEKESASSVIELTKSRIIERGENHASLTPKKTPTYLQVIYQFVHRRSPVDLTSISDCLIDVVINMKIHDPVKLHIHKLMEIIGPSCVPSESEVDNAVRAAIENKETIAIREQKRKQPVFYGFKIKGDVEKLVEEAFKNNEDKNAFWNQLVRSGRISTHAKGGWHITTAHKGTMGMIYKKYTAMWKAGQIDDFLNAQSTTPVQIVLKEIVWDDKVMTIVIDQDESKLDTDIKYPHITVSTVSADVPPATSNSLLKRIYDENDTTSVNRLAFPERTNVYGIFQAF